VTLVDTGQETQTGGRLRRVLPYIDSDTFLATYGDGLSNSNINETIAFHHKNGGLATITAVRQAGRFGNLTLKGPLVRNFKEKPEAQEDFISGGFFVFNKGIGDYLTSDATSLEAEALVGAVADGQVNAYRHEGFWQCMDTFREQQMLEKMYASGHAPWQIWSNTPFSPDGNGHNGNGHNGNGYNGHSNGNGKASQKAELLGARMGLEQVVTRPFSGE